MAPRKTTTATAATKDNDTAPEQVLDILDAAIPSDTIPVAEHSGDLSHFRLLNHINVSAYIEKKKTGNTELSYLSWANAWAELKKHYPGATYNIHRFGDAQLPYVYDENTGYMVFTDMTIEGITHTMWLPVMDGANKAMKNKPYEYTTGFGQYQKTKVCQAADMFDVNKTIMRCLVKNISMFGLGLYIYAGEDLPGDPDDGQSGAADAALKKLAEQQAAAETDHVVDIKRKIANVLAKKTSSATDQEKIALANDVIKPIIGMLNYTLCDDYEKLEELHKKLSA